jgi:glycosyltransferase involved in cell wall biosynthesis
VPEPPSKVLFVGHGAERTGPPIGLLHLLRWIHANTDLPFEVLLLEGGVLLPEYERLAPVHVLHESRLPRLAVLGQVLAGWGLAALGDRVKVWGYRRRLRGLRHVGVVYVNSAWCIRALRYVDAPEATVIAAVHEMEVGLDYHLDDLHRRLLVERPDRFLGVSAAVRHNLVERHGVDPARISLHHEMIEVERAPRVPAADPGRRMLVGASGLLRWRKGPDLYLAVAALVRRKRPDLDVRWTWIGSRGEPGDLPVIEQDRDAAGLADLVDFEGETSDPIARFADLDVFVLTSREDAYPLVCLEAASVGVPVVCFDAGGMPELVTGSVDRMVEDPRAEPDLTPGEPCGVVVRYPDLEAMADAVVALLDDPARAASLGARGARRVRELHAVEVAAPRLVADLAPWLDRGGVLAPVHEPSQPRDEVRA